MLGGSQLLFNLKKLCVCALSYEFQLRVNVAKNCSERSPTCTWPAQSHKQWNNYLIKELLTAIIGS